MREISNLKFDQNKKYFNQINIKPEFSITTTTTITKSDLKNLRINNKITKYDEKLNKEFSPRKKINV